MNLQDAKNYLRVDTNDDDKLISDLLAAAEQSVRDYLNQDTQWPMPAPVQGAVQLLVCELYSNRELQSKEGLYQNKMYYRLLNPYRKMDA